MSSPAVAYAPRPDATPETELNALASVYKFVLDCRAKKEGSHPGAPDDAKGSMHDRASQKYTRT